MEKFKKYVMDDVVVYTNPDLLSKDFVSWDNVWLFTQLLICVNALMWTFSQNGMGIRAVVVALVALWFIGLMNRI